MAKEGKNNFELKKGKRFQFDLSKNPKRTFDLVKDVDVASAVAGPIPTMADTRPPASQSTTEVQSTSTSNGTAKGMAQPATKKDIGKSGKQGSGQQKNQNNTAKQPKDTVAPQKPIAPAETNVTEDSGNEGGGSNKWMWIVGAILVVAIIAWLCVRGCSSSNDNGVTTEPTVETVEATGASEEEAVVEEPTVDEEEAQPSSSSEAETESPAAEEGASASTATAPETPAPAATATPASTPATATSETESRPVANTVSVASSAPAAEVSSDIEAEAMKVIRGDYGTGLERKLKLGSKYREIQNRVNELKSQGAF